MSHFDCDFSQNQGRRWKKINKDQLLNQGHSACSFLSVLHTHLFSFFGKHPFGKTSFDHYHNLLSQFKMKTQKLAFLVHCHLFFFFPPCTFISIVVFCKPSGHFGIRFGRKTQYSIKLPYTHLRVVKRLKTARKKPKGVWASGGHKGHFVFSLVLLSIIATFLSFISLYSWPSAVSTFASFSFFIELWDFRFGMWTMGITKTNLIFWKRKLRLRRGTMKGGSGL